MRTVMDLRAFGRLLRDARAARGMRQDELAARLKVGQQAVSNWERGSSRPKTRTLLLQLATIFPEYDPSRWCEVAGYSEASVPAKANPVRPLLEALPLHALSYQQFQGFSGLLLAFHFHELATVNAFGIEGDRQDGIDFEAHFLDGRYETFQCKRETKFGPEKVRSAIQRHHIKCDRAVILLSRRATAAARKAIPKRGKWSLWDTEDIARMIRALPLSHQRRIIGTYFPGHHKDFLGVNDDLRALQTGDDYFAPLLQRNHAFSHAWTLVGRDPEIAQLVALTDRPAREATLVVGHGGIGKSRLLRALLTSYATRHPDRAVFVLSPGAVPGTGDLGLMSEQPSLLIVEDAHDHAHLGAVLAAVARLEPAVRVVMTTRPYAANLIRSEAAHRGFHIGDAGTLTLAPLTLEQAESLAQEILADRKGPVSLAADIARLTRGSSLALVVGSHLVASAKIAPRALNSSTEFRDELYRGFRDAITGQIGSDSQREIIRDTLSILALCQPIDADSRSFTVLTEQLFNTSIDKVRRALQLLHDSGVLIQRERRFRIVPELLGEYILEEACLLRANRGSSGFVERVIPLCSQEQLANVVLNVSKLDWRLSESDEHTTRLPNHVWEQLEQVYVTGLGPDVVLEAVTQAAYYQPARALRFYDRLRERGDSCGELGRLLKHVAMNLDYVEDAVHRLWELARGDHRPLNSHPTHPLRIFHELSAIEPTKSVSYCERTVRVAMRVIRSRQHGTGDHSAFGALRGALATEGHTTEASGYSITLSGFGVRREAVTDLRKTIVDFALGLLTAAELNTALQAAETLQDALRYPHGLVGRVVSEEERHSWSVEFVETLRSIKRILETESLDPFVVVQLQHAVDWHARYADGPTQDEARAILAALPKDLSYEVSLALSDGWGHLALEGPDDLQRETGAWQERVKRVAAALMRTYPNVADAISILRERFRALRSIENGRASPGVFIGTLVEDYPQVADAICECVIASPDDPLRDAFWHGMYRVSMTNPKRALTVARRACRLGDVDINRNVASAYSLRLRTQSGVLPDERAFVEELIQSGDDATVRATIHGVAEQAQTDRRWAIATLLRAPIGRSPDTADTVLGSFHRSGALPFESLGEPIVSAFIDKLGECPSLDKHWIQEFIAKASTIAPARVARLLIDRIERAVKDSDGDLQPMPYLWDEQPRLRFRDAVDFSTHLRTIREWLLRAPKDPVTLFWGPKLYAAVAAGYDDTVLLDLESWMTSGDEDKFMVIARILAEAPRGFVFDRRSFVEELLEHGAAVSQKCLDRLRGSLWGSAISGMRHGTPGRPFPEDEARRDHASEALSQLSRGSPAWTLFEGLKEDAERDIRRSLQEDEERFGE